jgi:hypothetical protein
VVEGRDELVDDVGQVAFRFCHGRGLLS